MAARGRIEEEGAGCPACALCNFNVDVANANYFFRLPHACARERANGRRFSKRTACGSPRISAISLIKNSEAHGESVQVLLVLLAIFASTPLSRH